jgi:AcrR family transcriptional regulator
MVGRVRAGGRSERTRQKVGQACLALLAQGRTALSPADVAARAGVSRATVYRWWPTKTDLLREGLAAHTGRRIDPPDTGTWRDDLHALAHRLTAFFSDPAEVAMSAVMATGEAPEFDAFVLEQYEPVFGAWRAMVERARARNEVRADADADAVLLALAAPLVVIPLLFHRTPTDAEVAQLIDVVYAGSIDAAATGTTTGLVS